MVRKHEIMSVHLRGLAWPVFVREVTSAISFFLENFAEENGNLRYELYREKFALPALV